jgi:hypothetical protein
MYASLLLVLLLIATVILYVWFFRSKNSQYESQRNIPLQDDQEQVNNDLKKGEEKDDRS